MYEVRDFGGSFVRVVPVDSYLTELTLSLSGDKDDGDFLNIDLIDPSGMSVNGFSCKLIFYNFEEKLSIAARTH
jgi:hypothetical protein